MPKLVCSLFARWEEGGKGREGKGREIHLHNLDFIMKDLEQGVVGWIP